MIITCYSNICKDDSTLRQYQQKAKKEIFESWDEVDNVMFQMPTGTGKTRLFTSIISDINKYSIQRREAVKILIIAHRTELIEQIDKHLDNYHVPHNVIVGGKEKHYKYPVSVASIQTITNTHNIQQAKKLNVQFIIIDEAHHALAKSYKKLWDMYPNAKRLGVTATPWRMNHQSFLDLFDKLVMSMPIKDFIKQGFLAPYKYFSLRDDSYIQKTIDGIELDSFGEYKESSMEEKMDIGSIRAQLLKSYQSLAEGKKGIIYAINKAHARHICNEYGSAGYRVVSIDCNTPSGERNDLVKKFKRGEIDIIVNVDIFSEGFDCPDIEFIQLARPTCSLVKYLQQVGRGLRPTENKQNCVILDNVGMYSKFGLPDARRHWNYHFKGKAVVEEPAKYTSNGTGKSRFVDLSEGTEDMELIQDDYEDIETISDVQNESSSAIDDFFPLFGVTLGKTTWKQAKDMGYKVEKSDDGPSRNMNVEDVDFWDHDAVGIFTSLYWTSDESDFPPLWKSKGFDWILSYDAWIRVFERLGYTITITRKPATKIYSRRNTLTAEFEALSPDGTLYFSMDFNYGEQGCYTTSPRTLYSIIVDYKGEIEREIATDELETSTAIKGSKCLIFNDDGTEIIGCKDDDCENLIIPEGVTSIAKDAFENNKHIKTVSFPNSLISIGSSAFRGCAGITQISLNDNLEDIGFDAFRWSSLREVEIPYNVNDIGMSAFNCEIKVDSLNTDFEDIDGVLYNYDETKLIIYPSLKSDKNYDVVDGVEEIDYFAFEDSCLQFISLPNTIGVLGSNIFNGCKNLNKLTINVEDPNEIEVHKDCFVGFNKGQCKLIVPNGCKAKYSSHEMFKDFLSIEEISGSEDEDFKQPSVPIDPNKLDIIFEKKSTSYKYFWFMAIISLAKEKKSLTISYKDIVIRMAAMAWPIVFEYEIDLGNGDMIPKYLREIVKKTTLSEQFPSKVVEAYMSVYYESEGIDKILEPLLKNVPYRFLSPWIRYTSDEDVIEKSNSGNYACLYALREDCLILNEEWWNYIKTRYTKICNSSERSFVTYIQPRNKQHNKLTKFMSKGWSLI